MLSPDVQGGGGVMWGWRKTGVGTLCIALMVALAGGLLLRLGVARSSGPPQPPDAAAPGGRANIQPTPGSQSGQRVTKRPTPEHRGVRDATRGLVLPDSAPVSLSIPRIHVRSRLVRLGVDSAGAMEVPADPARPGWYDLGPTPGALGPAVIAGHVTWNRVPAVFFELGKLRPGDHVLVKRADGTRAVFAVHGVSRFKKTHFPTRRIFGTIDHAGLRLITCGGTYDESAHRYLANVVVFAALVAARPGA